MSRGRGNAGEENNVAHVLIVDDTDIVRRALELAVRRMGHAAVSTSDAYEALELAERQPPDLALLDYRMPKMSGAALFQRLRRALGSRCPKVVFVSATSPEDVAREVEPIGRVAGYMKKPFALDDLTRLVDEALGGRAEDAIHAP
jgi:two-component system OmpR family response regulator